MRWSVQILLYNHAKLNSAIIRFITTLIPDVRLFLHPRAPPWMGESLWTVEIRSSFIVFELSKLYQKNMENHIPRINIRFLCVIISSSHLFFRFALIFLAQQIMHKTTSCYFKCYTSHSSSAAYALSGWWAASFHWSVLLLNVMLVQTHIHFDQGCTYDVSVLMHESMLGFRQLQWCIANLLGNCLIKTSLYYHSVQ